VAKQAMITGEFRCSLDDKGRLLIPARMRTEVAGNVVILTRGVENCVWLFPPEDWKAFSENLIGSTSLFQEKARLIQRRMIAPAQEMEIDKAGRIVIPPTLREYAGLQKECIILGLKKYMEIWSESAYQAYLTENEAKFREAAEELGGRIIL
jgi:MraZ protein